MNADAATIHPSNNAPVESPTVALTFACTDCGRRAGERVECPCGAGELVDLTKPEFREMIVETEDRRAEAHTQRLLWVSVAIGIVSVVFSYGAVPSLMLAIPLPIPFGTPIKFLLLMIAVTVLTSKVLGAMIPARRLFPELVARRNAVALPANLLAVRTSTIVGVLAFIGLGVAITIAVPFVKAHIAKEEHEHAEAVEKRVQALDDCVAEGDLDECRKPLTSVYDSLDSRSNDMALKVTLESQFSCEAKCTTAPLAQHYGEIRQAAAGMGLSVDFSRSPSRELRPMRRPSLSPSLSPTW